MNIVPTVHYSQHNIMKHNNVVRWTFRTSIISASIIASLCWNGQHSLLHPSPALAEPNTSMIQGRMIDQHGVLSTLKTTITLASTTTLGVFTNNPYTTGVISPGTYTVSSSQPAGYNVSYSLNPSEASSSYTKGSSVMVTIAEEQTLDIWWKYTPMTGSIQGTKVDQNNKAFPKDPATSITIYGIGTFSTQTYDSGTLPAGTYTVSSSEPLGYSVSYAINPESSSPRYTPGSTVTIALDEGRAVNIWWKYTPVSHLNMFALELDNFLSSYSPSVLEYKNIKRMWTGSLTNDFLPVTKNIPNLALLPQTNGIVYSEYINGSWTKPFPERTFQKSGFRVNDPSVIAYPGVDTVIYMYYTAITDADAEQKISDRHKIGLAWSLNEGRSWQDKGIILDYPETGDGKGASSPSAIVVGKEIWVYYHTGTQDLSQPINWRVKFDLNLLSETRIGVPERLNFSGFIPGDPDSILTNLDVSYKNSQFVLLANTSDLKKIVRFVSDDGINWRRPSTGLSTLIEISDEFLLTPTIEYTYLDQYKLYFGFGSVSPSNTLSTMIRSKNFGTSSASPITTSIPETFFFTSNMRINQTSQEVAALQSCLKKDTSLYPQGLVTGYFGVLTQRAVIRFQEKFANEILVPAGLTSGSGFVGSLTRNKLNQTCFP